MSLWRRLFGRRRQPERLPFDWICRESMGITAEDRVEPAVSPATVEMMARARRKVDRNLEVETVRAAERLCRDGDINGALARASAAARLAEMKAELGISSPEQPDLLQKGPAPAQGDCER